MTNRLRPAGLFEALLLPAALAVAGVTAGCSMVGPDYLRPESSVVDSWSSPEAVDQAAAPTPSLVRWWEGFGDPTLDTLIAKGVAGSPTLEAAGLRVLEARARRGIAVGGLFPQSQNVGAGYAAIELSEERANRGPGLDSKYDDFQVGFDAAWELDLWGKFRRAVEASDADLLAEIASYDDVLVSLLSEIAAGYLQYRTIEERIVVAETNAAIQRRSAEITDARFRNGTVTELDVAQANSLLYDTESRVPAFRASLRQVQHSLEFLVGETPGALAEMLDQRRGIPEAPATVTMGVPAELLRRRPDVRRTERQLAAQSARIGVAKADLFPHFSLVGNISLAADDASDVFDGNAVEGFGGPSFSWAVLNYGRITNNVRVQDARYQALVSRYEESVLRAQSEVESAAAALRGARAQLASLEQSVQAAERAVELSNLQYREGAVDYIRLLNAQEFLATEQDRMTSTRGTLVVNAVALYKALGGGWEDTAGNRTPSAQTIADMQQRGNWGELDGIDPEAEVVESEAAGRMPFRRPSF